jgi:uncharacterized membrane protein YdjX (TVP38/TMEM64 family)/pimeloyl-ACP methyl ester carboxylesterase
MSDLDQKNFNPKNDVAESDPKTDPSMHWRFNQTRAAVMMELGLLSLAGIFVWSFWTFWCPEGVEACVGNGKIAPAHYLFLAVIRPFVLTPHVFGTYLAARSFSEFDAIVLSAIASTLSSIPVYYLCYLVGQNLVVPWMSHNLPRTLKMIKSQDYKFIFAARLMPLFPFDLVSGLAGVFTLNFKRFLVFSFVGILPECIFVTLMSSPKVTVLGFTMNSIGLTAGLILTPLLVLEWHSRKRGRSLFATVKSAFHEIREEALMTNQIVKRHSIDGNKTPVLLLYGFFSSRRSLLLLEKQLVAAGFDVLSFNMGGMFGTFFTQGVAEAAAFVDVKLKRQMKRHGFNKVHIVAHSKGSLVAYWWLLKLGGSQYCDRMIAMASPCSGSYYTYLALVTPLGFFWRDMWQMRPGSSFLRVLQDVEIPKSLKIWSFYSDADHFARGAAGVFAPRAGIEQLTVVGMHEYSHFDFILKRGPIREVVRILKGEEIAAVRDEDIEGTTLAQINGEEDSAA